MRYRYTQLKDAERSLELKKPTTIWEWICIRLLYQRSFPKYERKPFGIILSMCRKGKTDIWCLKERGAFAGFATTINDTDLILIDYLAVAEKRRGSGIGSFALKALRQAYPAKGIFVEIESAYEPGPDQDERSRRKRFYLRNGMKPSCVMANVFDVPMELLCWNCCVDFQRYHDFYLFNYSAWAA